MAIHRALYLPADESEGFFSTEQRIHGMTYELQEQHKTLIYPYYTYQKVNKK
jgi:hypothetical protein